MKVWNYNSISLLLGWAGWAIPFVQMGLRVRNRRGMGHFTPVFSMGACGLSIWVQICCGEYLIGIEDWCTLIIATRVSRNISLFLLVTTVLLNLILVSKKQYLDGRTKEDAK